MSAGKVSRLLQIIGGLSSTRLFVMVLRFTALFTLHFCSFDPHNPIID